VLGLVRPYKGFALLAEAWPAVREEVPDAVLVVAGQVLDPFPDLERLRRATGVVARLGWLSDRETELWATAADVCLLPYSHGAHSGVLHRAVANGTPCLVSPSLSSEAARFGAGPSVPLDPDEWAAAIIAALKHPPPPPRQPTGQPSIGEQMIAVYEVAIRSVRGCTTSPRWSR
jgi:glycosyltransferase involved in cell wall biosynthesis